MTSTTTLTDATGLTVALLANKSYRFRAMLVFDNAGTVAGIKVAMAGPTSPTKAILSGFLQNATTTVVHQVATSLTTILTQGIASTGVKYVVCEGVVINGVNAGNLKVQFAQNVSDGSATTLKAGSFLEVERID